MCEKSYYYCDYTLCFYYRLCHWGKSPNVQHEGMTKEELKSQLGKPDGFKRVEEYTIYTYTNRLISGWSWDRTDYYFIFKGENLQEYGTGEVRVNRSNTGVIMFIPITY